MNNPCKNCIAFPACLSQYDSKYRFYSILILRDKCCIISKFINESKRVQTLNTLDGNQRVIEIAKLFDKKILSKENYYARYSVS